MEGVPAGLLAKIERAVSGAAGGRGPVGVAYSGGVDSSVVAAVCRRAGLGPVLLTVGFAGSHDARFARVAARAAGLPHHTMLIGGGGGGAGDPAAPPFAAAAAEAVRATGGGDPSLTENCIAFYYIALLARSRGLRTVLTGNGFDELFCGYDAYRRALERAGVRDGDLGAVQRVVEPMVGERVARELSVMADAGRFAAKHGVRLSQPLLSGRFVSYAAGLPVSCKITGPGDLLRKHAVRRLASGLGVPPTSALKRKKAIQYGSRIHAELVRSGLLPAAA